MKPPERSVYPKVERSDVAPEYTWVIDNTSRFERCRMLPTGPAVWDGEWHLLTPEAKP
jgi:hypothetical protein